VNDDSIGYNTLADLPGTDKADEYVMFGGHLDSWHAGTGATDNASGIAVVMEAMRILKALDLKPRRTIRVGIWTSEEGRHLGVAGWIARHPELWPKISVYLNLDNGAGSCVTLGPVALHHAPCLRADLHLRELGVQAIPKGNVGGNEHQDPDDVGIPGFTFLQDPLEYTIRSHHSSADTFERLIPDDLKQAATVMAWTAYTLANRDELFPRKPGK
jgi:Zn-dependent M28 family amino/carboxypeptidase